MGEFSGNSSSRKNVDKTDLDGVSTPQDGRRQKKRAMQLKTAQGVGSWKNNGNGHENDADVEDNEIERIDVTEFYNKKKHAKPKIRLSPRQELNEDFAATSSCKNVDSTKKKHSADLYGKSPENVSHGSSQGLLIRKGKNTGVNGNFAATSSKNVGAVGKDIFCESISPYHVEAHSNQGSKDKSSSIGKKRTYIDLDFEETGVQRIGKAELMNHKARSLSKNVASASKKTLSANNRKSFSPEDACHGFDQASPELSLSKRGNDSENMDSDEPWIEKISEAEFRNQKTHFMPRNRPSVVKKLTKDQSAASFGKKVDGPSKNIFSAGKNVDGARKNVSSADQCVNNSSPSLPKGNSNKCMSSKKTKIVGTDEAFKNEKSRAASKTGFSSRQGQNKRYSAASFWKNAVVVKEISIDDSSRSFSSGDDGRDSDEEQTDKSSSSAETGNNDEDTDLEDIFIEKIPESELKLRYKRTDFVSKIGSSRAAASAEKVNNSLIHCISSSSNTHSRNDTSEDDGISTHHSGHETNHGIASRTRSRTATIKKASEVKTVLDSSDDSDSSSTDSGSDDEDFKVDGTSNSDDIELLYSNDGAFDVQNNTSMEVSAKKSADFNEEEGSSAKHVSKWREENEETNKIVRDDAEEGRTGRTDGNTENLAKCSESKHLGSQKECAEAERVDGLPPKDQSQASIRRQKKVVSPSHSKDDRDASDDDDILEKNDVTSPNIHGNGKNEKVDVTDENKKPIKSKQASPEHYDFCKMLADSVLGRVSMPETMRNNEEAKQAPASQTRIPLPSRFGFENEIPKEVEKTDSEKETKGLFAELDFCWTSQDLGSFKYSKVVQDNGSSPAEETPYARCSRGKHELIWIDDQGLVCKYCHHVELGPKDVMPQWAERTYRESGRRRPAETEGHPEFDELHLNSSTDNYADSRNVANGTVWSLKPGVRESMYEHQQEGFEFLWKNLAGSIHLDELKSSNTGEVGGCIISHAPGTGKTRLTIVFIETYMKLFPNCRPVIIAPASMLLTWEEEFRKWNVEFPFLNLNTMEIPGKENKTAFGLLAGAKHRNMKTIRMVNLFSWDQGRNILGISYSLFEKLTGEKDGTKDVRKILLEKPGLLVLDEGHTPRNQRSNIWNALLKLQTEKRVILSGTPFQNNFAELFNTLRIVRPALADALAQEKTFAEMIASRRKHSRGRYQGETSQSTLISEVDDRAVEKLKVAMSPFVHVHKGTILQQSLPGLRDCVVLLKPPALQKSLIDRLEGRPSTFRFEHKAALLSVHPYLFQHCDSTEEQRIGIDMASVEASKLNPNDGVKTKFILEFLRLSMAMNEKVLIFSQYIQPLELIKEQLKEIFNWVEGKEILQMQGKLDQKQRQILINLFNDLQNESRVMLASTRCCSEGISLVGASRVILLDVVWNPSVERQAISRAYRIGQKKFVYTYHLMTSGTTEADKYCRQAEKERLSELVFTSSSNEINDHKLHSSGIEDRILEVMVDHENLKEMFEKIINQPKDTNLIQTFGLTS